MKYIEEYVMEIDDELESAKDYVEKSIYYKTKNESARQKSYFDMANDELKHARILHEMAVEDIAKLEEKGYTPTEPMQEVWIRAHKGYIEKAAWVRQMLTM